MSLYACVCVRVCVFIYIYIYIYMSILPFTGGMGNNYSLPRTPEDFLSNVDEMDTQEGGKC